VAGRDYRGLRPLISIWLDDADIVVDPANAPAIATQ
jgi:hypothetical protein